MLGSQELSRFSSFFFIQCGDIEASLNAAGNYLVGRGTQRMQLRTDHCRSKKGWGGGGDPGALKATGGRRAVRLVEGSTGSGYR